MDPETRVQALRGAAGAKPPQCAQARRGDSECSGFSPGLFRSLKSSGNKGWARRVPAAAVIPAARVVATIIGPKTSVAGLVNAWVNREAQPHEFRADCQAWDRERPEVLQG